MTLTMVSFNVKLLDTKKGCLVRYYLFSFFSLKNVWYILVLKMISKNKSRNNSFSNKINYVNFFSFKFCF